MTRARGLVLALRRALPCPERGERVHDLDHRGLEVGVDRGGRRRADQRGGLCGPGALRDRRNAVEAHFVGRGLPERLPVGGAVGKLTNCHCVFSSCDARTGASEARTGSASVSG